MRTSHINFGLYVVLYIGSFKCLVEALSVKCISAWNLDVTGNFTRRQISVRTNHPPHNGFVFWKFHAKKTWNPKILVKVPLATLSGISKISLRCHFYLKKVGIHMKHAILIFYLISQKLKTGWFLTLSFARNISHRISVAAFVGKLDF